MLSHSLWQPGGVTRTVSGVMPEGFWFPSPTVRVWPSEELGPENGSGTYALVARTPRHPPDRPRRRR